MKMKTVLSSVRRKLSTVAFVAASAVGVGLATAMPSHAALTSVIDFSTLGTDVTPLLTSAITTAAGIGAAILAAKLCWNFFRRFLKG